MKKTLVVTHWLGSVAEQGPAGFFRRTALTLAADKGKWWEFFLPCHVGDEGNVK